MPALQKPVPLHQPVSPSASHTIVLCLHTQSCRWPTARKHSKVWTTGKQINSPLLFYQGVVVELSVSIQIINGRSHRHMKILHLHVDLMVIYSWVVRAVMVNVRENSTSSCSILLSVIVVNVWLVQMQFLPLLSSISSLSQTVYRKMLKPYLFSILFYTTEAHKHSHTD